ncbi:MAG: PHP domain-containing protein [Acidobacteriota bacterium]|nr:PHP domain-containing protein [Acidobacteriota bacterium]
MKLDTHVHTHYSGFSTIKPLDRIMRESYNTVEGIYRIAKARGMDLVAITDHDTIEGALTIADRPDVVIGCEVTGVFPNDGARVHLGVLGLTECHHREIQRRRGNIAELMPYLAQEELFVSLNHVASRVNGDITATHIAALMPWLSGIEVRNGSRLRSQNRTAAALASAHHKTPVAGSDSHTCRGVGRTWIEAPGARTREEFMDALHAGRVRPGGGEGHYFTMASDICRIATRFYAERFYRIVQKPGDWRRHAFFLCAALGIPLVAVPLTVAFGHFVLEERFNRGLLLDLVANRSLRVPEVA